MQKRGQLQTSGFHALNPERFRDSLIPDSDRGRDSPRHAQKLLRNKRAVFDMSFGMIFSIIIIIATVAVAFYVISTFMKTGKCVQVGLFYEDLQKEIDKTWRAPAAQTVFTHSLPSGVEEVCFGNAADLGSAYAKEKAALQRIARNGHNTFLYPEGICENLGTTNLEKVSIPTAFCVKQEKGKVSCQLTKSSSAEQLVTLRPKT